MNEAVTLRDAQSGHVTIMRLWSTVKPLLMQGRRISITVRDATRSSEQNALLHAMLTDISRTREWAGAKRDPETWKRLFVAGWLRARGESVEILPAIDGHGVDVVFRRTSTLTVSECGELIDYIAAWQASA